MKKCLLLLWLSLVPLSAQAADNAWQAWQSGEAVLLMRHALAPGVGDPSAFQLNNCQTQRNLNATGKAQAQAWGERLRQRYAGDVQVFSSQWCRCLDTARLLGLGAVTPLAVLNSFFAGRGDADKQTAALIAQFSFAKSPEPIVLVSHQVNITALTGIFPQSAEALIVALPLTQPAKVLARLPAAN